MPICQKAVFVSQALDIAYWHNAVLTGIPGFVIGNTVQNLVRTLPAAKPNGFDRPMKAC